MSDAESRRCYWQWRVRRLADRLNYAWWLQAFLFPFVAGCVLTAFSIVFLRRAGTSVGPVFSGFLFWSAGAVLFAVWKTRACRVGLTDSLARLDSALGSRGLLVSAAAGVGDWPEIPERFPSPFSWRYGRILPPFLLGITVLVLSWLLPIGSPFVESAKTEIREPAAWSVIDSAIERLTEEKIIREDALERVSEQVAALRATPPENWYAQNVLEATDHLRSRFGESARELSVSLQRSASLLALAEEARGKLSESRLLELGERFQKTIDALEKSALPLDESLLNELRKIDPSQLKTLSPEKLKELRKRLSENGKCLKECAVACKIGESGDGTFERDLADMLAAIDGPDDALLTLRPPVEPPADLRPEAIRNSDMSRAAVGDLIALKDDRHEVDRDTDHGAIGAGSVSSSGGGGEAVWRLPLLPSERRILDAYFE